MRKPVLNTLDEIVYTMPQVAALLHCGEGYARDLVRYGLLPGIKLGSLKVSKVALDKFLIKYEGKDLTDPSIVKELEFNKSTR